MGNSNLMSIYRSNSEIRPALNLVVHKVVLWNVGLITLIIHTLSKLAALHFLAAASFLVLVRVLITSIQLASISFQPWSAIGNTRFISVRPVRRTYPLARLVSKAHTFSCTHGETAAAFLLMILMII